MSDEIPKQVVRVESRNAEASGIVSLELRAADRASLPAFEPGAHIDLYLPNGLVRSYSLISDPGERHRYVVAINRDAASRGGSQFVHDSIKPGDELTVSTPRNNFRLTRSTADSVFIAGGIGVTPILCMVRALEADRQPWQLYYAARSRSNAAFLDVLTALAASHPERLVLHFDDEHGGRPLDIPAIVARQSPQAHIYCCGPLPMLNAFEAATASRFVDLNHVEYFAAKEGASTEGGYVVELSRSKLEFVVEPGKSILDLVLEAGVEVPYSCTEGICGSCETRVLQGEPDHRDLVLSKSEQASNKTMMICCSGSKSSRLVLDL